MKLTRRKAGTQAHITQSTLKHHSRFRGYLRDVGKVAGDECKPVTLPQHSTSHVTIWNLPLRNGGTESRKNVEQRFIYQIGTRSRLGINECFSFNKFTYVYLFLLSFFVYLLLRSQVPTNRVASSSPLYKPTQPTIFPFAPTKG